MDTQSIPGLNLLNSNTDVPAINKSAMSSTTETAISKAQGYNPASDNPVPLQSLEDWLDSNPEPAGPQPQQKKKKKAPDSLAIVPITLDPKDKTNWIGKLYEYWALLPEPGTITEEMLDLPPPHLFTCTITTSESSLPFGGQAYCFLKKKDAKQHAAKLAVEYLIQTGHISSDVKSKEPTTPATPKKKSQVESVPIEDQSIAAQVNYLAHKLGFKSPSYVIKLVPETTALYSGYAYFTDEPLIEGKVGEFDKVWAKKSAKEKCATEVLEFLKGIERHREGHAIGEAGSAGKRKLGKVESPEGKGVTKTSKHDGRSGGDGEGEEEDDDSIYGTPKSGV